MDFFRKDVSFEKEDINTKHNGLSMFSTFFSAGLLDQNPSLEPLLHPSKDNMQAEIGISAFKIFGFIYMEFSKRLIGDYGNEIGFVVLF